MLNENKKTLSTVPNGKRKVTFRRRQRDRTKIMEVLQDGVGKKRQIKESNEKESMYNNKKQKRTGKEIMEVEGNTNDKTAGRLCQSCLDK